jgi:hypothetical protein
MAADLKTASLRSRPFTSVRESAIFGLPEPFNVHGCSPTFAGVGVTIGVMPISPRCLSFSEALWPPVEKRGRADQIGTGLQRHTASGLGVLQLIDRGEMPVHQDGIGERPQMLGRLELRGVRRQEEQVDVVGYAQALGAMPARAIKDEDDLLRQTGTDRAGKGCELRFKDVLCASPFLEGCLGSQRCPPVLPRQSCRGMRNSYLGGHVIRIT